MTVPRTGAVDALQTDQLADEIVRFSLDGVDLEILLSAMNAHRLREILAAFIPCARRQTLSRRAPTPLADPHDLPASQVRAWAIAKGWTVGGRGRVPDEVWRAYVRKHHRPDGSAAAAVH